MHYPTLEEVERADRVQLARWHRFLTSPGSGATDLDYPIFKQILDKEVKIMNRIEERFKALGGMCPEISKEIGWNLSGW